MASDRTASTPPIKLFDVIGIDGLRAVITEFYRRVFDDVMIGFLFAGKDQRRLIDKEVEFTARLLGADMPYTGKPLRAAHAPHRIFGGQFERRLQILRDAMEAHAVDAEVQRVWIEHTNALRAQITADPGSDCRGDGGGAPAAPPPRGVIGLRRRQRR